jgi:general secretion pathway protein C
MWGSRLATLLRQYGWGLNLIFIALAAYFVAGAANAVVASGVRVVPSVDDMAVVPVSSAAVLVQPGTSTTFTAMAERNLINARREVLTPAGQSGASAPDLVTGKDFKETDLRPCTLAASLRATLVADSAPEWSIAVLSRNSDHETVVCSINGGSNQIVDDAVLVDIRSREIVVRRRDHFEICSAEGENAAARIPVMATPPPPAVASADSSGGVTQISETQYNVQKSEVDRALGNLSEVATEARIVPNFKDGKANGFKMFSIKPGSIYAKIGLQNGDVIQKINGYVMDSPDKALELYQKLRDASSVSIELNRRGQNSTLNYAIVP